MTLGMTSPDAGPLMVIVAAVPSVRPAGLAVTLACGHQRHLGGRRFPAITRMVGTHHPCLSCAVDGWTPDRGW